MASRYEGFLVQQNDRLKFYNQDFWEAVKFFSALTLLLLSAPFAIWAKDLRPHNWSVVAAGAPALGTLLAVVAYVVLKRTATSYYETGAAVVVLEGLLALHHFEGAGHDPSVPIVSSRRIAQGKKSVNALTNDFKSRLKGVFGTSRMSVVVNLFIFYAFVGAAETLGLLLHGFLGINVISILKR